DRRAVEGKGDPGFHRMPEDGFDITGCPAVACDDIGMPAMRRPVREQGRADIIRPVHDDDRSTLSDPRRHRFEIGGEGGVVSPAREGEQAEEMMRSQGYVTHIRPRSLPRGLTATSVPAASADLRMEPNMNGITPWATAGPNPIRSESHAAPRPRQIACASIIAAKARSGRPPFQPRPVSQPTMAAMIGKATR